MRPKEVHCVCPFLKGKPMNRGEFFELSESGHMAEAGLNFQGVDAIRLTSFLVHTAKIEKAYYLGNYEVTQKQWREVMGINPSNFKGDNLPVENVSWNDAQDFVKKLNEKEGTDKYRLPSEAEWEYAARAGTTTRHSFGDYELRSNIADYVWCLEYNNWNYTTNTVGQRLPNSWGLYDIHGNVGEMVQGRWHTDYDGAPTDGSAWVSGSSSRKVFRGGSWANSASGDLRSASRMGSDPSSRAYSVGFRLLKEV